jgi:hypothetical protein
MTPKRSPRVRRARERVHMPMEGFSRFDDTWVSECGIFEPKHGAREWSRVTCLRCLKKRASQRAGKRKGKRG